MKQFVIKCDFYQKKPTCKVLGATTLAVVTDYSKEPNAVVYLREYDKHFKEPRFNVKEVAMRFSDEKIAKKVADKLSSTSFDEGKIIAIVEEV